MPDVSPFRGVRYDVARVGRLSDVVAPPYDVIDPALQDRLYQASPYNVIRLELNRSEPGDTAAQGRYTRAARFLRDWLRQGILREEDHPALYVIQQTFEVEGVIHKVTVEALKRKARQLGEVQQITEDRDGSLTIVVKV